MRETNEQYVARISGYVEGQNHFKVFQSTVSKLQRLLKRVTSSRLKKQPAPNKWSVPEILGHLAESEIVFGYRVRMILGSNGTPIQAFDQNKWHENAGYLARNSKMSFELFRIVRESNVALLKSLIKEQWDFHGNHQERGHETIARMVELYAGHDVNHVKQIEGILDATRSKRTH
jgi:hypothetical protein